MGLRMGVGGLHRMCYRNLRERAGGWSVDVSAQFACWTLERGRNVEARCGLERVGSLGGWVWEGAYFGIAVFNAEKLEELSGSGAEFGDVCTDEEGEA